jgi:hypothetical protein
MFDDNQLNDQQELVSRYGLKNILGLSVLIVLLLLVSFSNIYAQAEDTDLNYIPSTIFLQATLDDSSGLLDGEKRVVIRLFSGNEKQTWQEVHKPVTFNNGTFTVELGRQTPFKGEDFAIPSPNFRLLIDGFEAIFPIHAIPYSYRASIAESVSPSLNVRTVSISEKLTVGQATPCGNTGLVQILGDVHVHSLYVSNNILVDGRIGIGTTSPSFDLDVAGTINAKALYLNGSEVQPFEEYARLNALSLLSTENGSLIVAKENNWQSVRPSEVLTILGLSSLDSPSFNALIVSNNAYFTNLYVQKDANFQNLKVTQDVEIQGNLSVSGVIYGEGIDSAEKLGGEPASSYLRSNANSTILSGNVLTINQGATLNIQGTLTLDSLSFARFGPEFVVSNNNSLVLNVSSVSYGVLPVTQGGTGSSGPFNHYEYIIYDINANKFISSGVATADYYTRDFVYSKEELSVTGPVFTMYKTTLYEELSSPNSGAYVAWENIINTPSFCLVGHKHTIEDLSAGVMTIDQGGTGSTSANYIDGQFIIYDQDSNALIAAGVSLNSYYTKSELSSAQSSAQINWANLINTPSLSLTSHTHSGQDITTGTVSIDHGGTGAQTFTPNMFLIYDTQKNAIISAKLSPENIYAKDQVYSITDLQTPGSANVHWKNIINTPNYSAHTHPTSDIIYGIFSIERGGTGTDNYQANEFIIYNSLTNRFESAGVSSNSYYLKTQVYTKEQVYSRDQLQTPGSAQIHWLNLTNTPNYASANHTHTIDDFTAGVFSVARGGTGNDSYTENKLLIFDGTKIISSSLSTSSYYLKSELNTQGIEKRVHWSRLTATPNAYRPKPHYHTIDDVTGTFAIHQGGTGTNTFNIGEFIVFNGSTLVSAGVSPNNYYSKTELYTKSELQTVGSANIHWDNIVDSPEQLGLNHKHPTADITEGVFGIEHGGTGASTPEQARANLGVLGSSGGEMTGPLFLPANGLTIGEKQFTATLNRIGIGTTQPAGDFHIASGENTIFIAKNDKIGLGTSDPSHLLTLQGTDSPTLQIIGPSAADKPSIWLKKADASSGTDWRIQNNENGSLIFQAGYDELTNNAFRNPALTIKSDGKVGIGTSNPMFLLDVNGAIKLSGKLIFPDNSEMLFAGAGTAVAVAASKNVPITADSDGTGGDGMIVFKIGEEIAMIVSQNGNVGIGTTLPAYTLDIAGTVNATGFAGNGAGLTNIRWENIINTPNFADHEHSADDITSGILSTARGGTGTDNYEVNKFLVFNEQLDMLVASDFDINDFYTKEQLVSANGTGQVHWRRIIGTENIIATPAAHTHSVNDIISGTLPIERGGTGADNAQDAANNLGAVSKEGATMTGPLNLPENGLNVGDDQLVLVNGRVGIGTSTPEYDLHVIGTLNATYVFGEINADDIKTGTLPTKSYNALADLGGYAEAGTDCLRKNGTWGNPYDETLEEAAVEAAIFDADNGAGVLGSGQLALSSLNYTGTMSGSYISGGTFGPIDGSQLTNLNASQLISGVITANRLPAHLKDFANSGQIAGEKVLSGIDASHISNGLLSNNHFDALSDLNNGITDTTTFLRRDGTWFEPEENPLGEAEIEAMIFDGEFEGDERTLSGCIINLSSITYEGTLHGNYVAGGTFGAVNAENLTNLNADSFTHGTIPTSVLNEPLQDLADGKLSAARIENGQFFIDTAGTQGQVWTSNGAGKGQWTTLDPSDDDADPTNELPKEGLDIIITGPSQNVVNLNPTLNNVTRINFPLNHYGLQFNSNQTRIYATSGEEENMYITAKNNIILQPGKSIGIGTNTPDPAYALDINGSLKVKQLIAKPKVNTFNVGGQLDRYYPYAFKDVNWDDGPFELEISRANINMDAPNRGSLIAIFKGHAPKINHGSHFIKAEIYATPNHMIAGYANHTRGKYFIVWLKGGNTTYYWRSNQLMTLHTTTTVDSFGLDGESFVYKETIDDYVNRSGIYLDDRTNLIVKGEIGLGTTTPQGKIHAVGTDGLPALSLSGDSGDAPIINASGSTYGMRLQTKDSDSNHYVLYATGAAGKGIIVKSNGWIGVGTEDPQAPLHVMGDIRYTGELIAGSMEGTSPEYDSLENVCVVYIRGTGANNTAKRVVRLANQVYNEDGPQGLKLSVVNKSDHSVLSNTNYDLVGDQNAADALATKLNAMTKAQVGIIASWGQWEAGVNDNLRNAFERVGLIKAATISNDPVRRPYAAIFEAATSLVLGKSAEVLHPNSADAPYADLRGWLIDGSFVASGTLPNYLTSSQGDKIAVMVNDDGNVGIGTNDPDHLLSIKTAADAGGLAIDAHLCPEISFAVDGTTYSKIAVAGQDNKYASGTQAHSLILQSDQALSFITKEQISLFINAQGNVGIGTYHPVSKLDIARSTSTSGLSTIGTMRILDTAPQLDFVDADHQDWAIRADANKLFFIREPNSTDTLVLDGNGNVGIGIASPTERLAVLGNILSSKLIDLDNNNYYLDPSSTSRLNKINTNIIYDIEDPDYYLNPAGVSRLKEVSISKFTDPTDTNYYIQPAAKIAATLKGSLALGDDNEYSTLAGHALIQNHSGTLYLSPDHAKSDQVVMRYSSYDRLKFFLNNTINDDTPHIRTDGNALYIGAKEGASIYLNNNQSDANTHVVVKGYITPDKLIDRNDTTYYIDPSHTSRVKTINAISGFQVNGLNQWALFEHDDFEQNQNGWTIVNAASGTLRSTFNNDYSLGGYNICGPNAYMEKVYYSLPPHTYVKVVLTYHFIDSWAGESGLVKIDNDTVWSQTSNANQHGINCTGTSVNDNVGQNIEIIRNHAASSVRVTATSTISATGAYFAIDDVMIFIR